MVIDSSALIAIILGEPSEALLEAALARETSRIISSVSLLETGMVLRARIGQEGVDTLYRIIERLDIEVIPFEATLAKLGIAAFARYGKGMGHKAQLNFGDCAVYALALTRGEPVLATGKDFLATDIRVQRY